MDENVPKRCTVEEFRLASADVAADRGDRVLFARSPRTLWACPGWFDHLGKMQGHIMIKGHPPQVGAVDPELRTSPILDDEQEFSLDLELESGACYFNNVAYPIGQFVLSGNELLHCEGRGLWVRKGEMRTD